MNPQQSTSAVKALGLCSGGLDSRLAALVLKEQGIEVSWISFETPFFSADSARKAADQTGIPLVVQDITTDYMEMMKAPKAGFGKNMNPCMDCHTLMFAKAGLYMEKHGYDFLFSGEVMGLEAVDRLGRDAADRLAVAFGGLLHESAGQEGDVARPSTDGRARHRSARPARSPRSGPDT